MICLYLTADIPSSPRRIPFPEINIKIPKKDLGRRFTWKKKCTKGKYKDVEVEVTIDSEITETSPSFSRKGRATFGIQLPNRNENFHYAVSVTNIILFDPEGEVYLNDFAAEAENMPFKRDMVMFDIDLGLRLKEKIDTCASNEIELEFKIFLHKIPKYFTRELCVASDKFIEVLHRNQL